MVGPPIAIMDHDGFPRQGSQFFQGVDESPVDLESATAVAGQFSLGKMWTQVAHTRYSGSLLSGRNVAAVLAMRLEVHKNFCERCHTKFVRFCSD